MFNKGDKAYCVTAIAGLLTKDKAYVVEEVTADRIKAKADDGEERYFAQKDFVTEAAHNAKGK